MRINWWQRLILGVLAVLFAIPVAVAKNLRIVTIEVAPFGFVGENGKPTGMMYEIGNLIATEAGFTYSNQLVPYARSAHAVVHGDADFVLRYSSAELIASATQVVGVLSLPTIVLGKAPAKFESLADLRGKTVGNPRGGRFDPAFEADTAILKHQVSDYSQMLKMLMNGRLDAGIGSAIGLYYNAQRLGLHSDQLGKPLVLSTQTFELHYSKKTADNETLTALRDAVARLKARQAIRKIVDQYLDTFDWYLTLPLARTANQP